ncbi:hypothetical protein SAMN06296036_1226 [Pseudobacteriovorax antillogorgiicola]|uniref:Uncharacterized protein n=1 Tax=Pseudobacteriovorax antillogorgiicola TaxID=1513793 RepID=A0A1Y6CI29_9BACT|nr:hypothetical protein EDD56_1226 [Pseudobacteriovorax antillogorgiicola]SMF64115.1 hypothetical protein SAMN06296036_1226 [Pseudobacteriovorax antillogorgiicola]
MLGANHQHPFRFRDLRPKCTFFKPQDVTLTVSSFRILQEKTATHSSDAHINMIF